MVLLTVWYGPLRSYCFWSGLVGWRWASRLVFSTFSSDVTSSTTLRSVLVVIYLPSVLVVCVGIFSSLVGQLADRFAFRVWCVGWGPRC